MRISVRVGEFVVHAMVSNPFNHIVLSGHGLHKHQHYPHFQVGFECSVSVESMCTNRCAKSWKRADDPADRQRAALLGEGEAIDRGNVKVDEQKYVAPLDFDLVLFWTLISRLAISRTCSEIKILRIYINVTFFHQLFWTWTLAYKTRQNLIIKTPPAQKMLNNALNCDRHKLRVSSA